MNSIAHNSLAEALIKNLKVSKESFIGGFDHEYPRASTLKPNYHYGSCILKVDQKPSVRALRRVWRSYFGIRGYVYKAFWTGDASGILQSKYHSYSLRLLTTHDPEHGELVINIIREE